jgi:hypothetical protein
MGSLPKRCERDQYGDDCSRRENLLRLDGANRQQYGDDANEHEVRGHRQQDVEHDDADCREGVRIALGKTQCGRRVHPAAVARSAMVRGDRRAAAGPGSSWRSGNTSRGRDSQVIGGLEGAPEANDPQPPVRANAADR